MRSVRVVIIALMVLIFLLGMVISLYPYICKAVVDTGLRNDAQTFLDRVTAELWADALPPGEQEPTELPYGDLLEAMEAYNRQIWEEKQAGLCDPWSYQQPSFSLGNYGLDSEVFGVISIPKLDLELPLYLGATYQHMADGAAHLSQTSIPIGGMNTNSVIAGHRGWYGASYFRYITELEPGDEVIVTNLWGTLTYQVAEMQVIWPHEVDQILIQEGRDLITLLTCHPYASGGKQRYLVICERAK